MLTLLGSAKDPKRALQQKNPTAPAELNKAKSPPLTATPRWPVRAWSLGFLKRLRPYRKLGNIIFPFERSFMQGELAHPHQEQRFSPCFPIFHFSSISSFSCHFPYDPNCLEPVGGSRDSQTL